MKPCLIVVFNHRFEANLPILRALYKDRFEHVFFLMPFYQGHDPDVIHVVESSARFQGYFAQALPRVYEEGFTHYVFVADDLLLDPALNQESILPALGVGPGSGYIKELIAVSDETFDWPFLYMALKACRFNNFVNAREELPPRAEALQRFADQGLSTRRLGWRNLPRLEGRHFARSLRNWILSALLLYAEKGGVRDIVYPLARGYSDLVVVPAGAVSQFCHVCGVLAAMGIFVECAIPTALVLTVRDIRLATDLPRQGVELLHDWNRREFEDLYERRMERLRGNFPADALYVHPVKLSRWQVDA